MNERLEGEGLSSESPSPSNPPPSPSRLSAGGEADQHEFLPDNSFWESNMAESLIFSPYFLK
jgi:hypothetical protein